MRNKIRKGLENSLPLALGIGSMLVYEIGLLNLAEKAGLYDNIDCYYGGTGMACQDMIDTGILSLTGGGASFLTGIVIGYCLVEGTKKWQKK